MNIKKSTQSQNMLHAYTFVFLEVGVQLINLEEIKHVVLYHKTFLFYYIFGDTQFMNYPTLLIAF